MFFFTWKRLLPALYLLGLSLTCAGQGNSPVQIIPVVVHIINHDPGSIPDQAVIDGIADLNNAFGHTGPYAAGSGTDTRIQFCLAKTDPDGGITNGITRTQSVLSDFDQDIENSRLKNLNYWDTRQYYNIWLVEGLKDEIWVTFQCGVWSRNHDDGYANNLPGGDYRDGVVTTSFGSPLATLTAGYLGLPFTFTFGNCTNNNCDTDGDGICDTPPSSAPVSSCTAVQNSCTSDTLSGFKVDMPDLADNFMSGGSCGTSFTPGQAAKMMSYLLNYRSSLLQQPKCSSPCGAAIAATFTRDNWTPLPGDVIHFTSASTGGTNYQWTVDGTIVGGNSPALAWSFTQSGKYKVTLKVYNDDTGCYATYTDFIIVTCGVMARFYPDKRTIASKAGILLDKVVLTNRSVGATSYEWLISSNTGMAPQVVSTSAQLTYTFQQPGSYSIWLIAASGSCRDTTEKLTVTVLDPTVDGLVYLNEVECYEQTKVQVSLTVCNNGYVPSPTGTPVSFYDGDPRTDTARLLGPAFVQPSDVLGHCCNFYSTILDVGTPGLNQLYAVFNDNGSTKPLHLPNTNLPETEYDNNIFLSTGFRFHVSVTPLTSTLQPGDTLLLSATASPLVAGYTWSTAQDLDCTNCATPIFIAEKKNVVKEVVATSINACVDSAQVIILVPPADDYTVEIDSVECAAGDSVLVGFTLCNHFKRGILPQGLKVSFYDADPSQPGARLLETPFITTQDYGVGCLSFTHRIAGIPAGKIFAEVNDSDLLAPVVLPITSDTLYTESNYTNNGAAFAYQPAALTLTPADTTVFRKDSFLLQLLTPIYDPSTINWGAGAGYTLGCASCLVTPIKVVADGTIPVQAANQYGCLLHGSAVVKIFPPDLQVHLLETHCYTNDTLQVAFSICMNNAYDSLWAGIPVSFYDGDPLAGGHVLEPTFYTPAGIGTSCDTFTMLIRSPATTNLYAVVNDRGGAALVPDTVYNETNFANDTAYRLVPHFGVAINPSDTTIPRLTDLRLLTAPIGGQITSYTWDPDPFLSCLVCYDPIVRPRFTQTYTVRVRNEYRCTADSSAIVRTSTAGPVNIPNAFSPNYDGHNDVFYVMGSKDVVSLKEFAIYNRWGQRVFFASNVAPNDPRYGWDGYVHGKRPQPDTYTYFVTVVFSDGRQEVVRGVVELVL